jgi:hypothetical protein
MRRVPHTLARLCIASISAIWLCGLSMDALGQDHASCVEVKDVIQSCSAIRWVSVERGKPFIAQRVVKSWDQSFHENDLVARDADGRIYIEQHDLPWQFYSLSSHREANIIWALGTANIFDCFGGKVIHMVPGSRTAEIVQACANGPYFQQSNHPYSYALTLLLILKTSADVYVEDLGNKQIGGFQTLGARITWFGTDKDGAWNRKPIRAAEVWRSDDLGATLLMVSSDFKKNVESRSVLTNIKRVDPVASLFEVPPGYKTSDSRAR